LKVIGTGGFSKVILARKIDSGRLYALKVIKKELVQTRYMRVQSERDMMLLIDSPHVVKLNWAFQTQSELCIVMDYHPGGELFYHM
jgi:serum/glucocorticoid-regulated kinase 2